MPPPETVRQARRWEQVKNMYNTAGLCYRCACQAGWGHQQGAGWKIIYAPCTDCAGVIARFPLATSNPLWRKLDLNDAARRGEAEVIPMPNSSAGADAPQSNQEEVAS